MTTETASDDFVSLWPTIVLKRVIPDHEEANLALIELITEHDRSSSDMTTEYLREEFLSESGTGGAWGRFLVCLSRRNSCGGTPGFGPARLAECPISRSGFRV